MVGYICKKCDKAFKKKYNYDKIDQDGSKYMKKVFPKEVLTNPNLRFVYTQYGIIKQKDFVKTLRELS